MIKRTPIAASVAVITALSFAAPAMAVAECEKGLRAINAAAKKAKLSKDDAASLKYLQKKAQAEIKEKKKECENTLAEAKKILELK